MLSEEILSRFDGGGRQNFYSFETFILNILKYHIESQGRKFSLVENIRGLGDAYAEEGFDDFHGKTIVEITLSLDRMPSRMIVEQIVKDYSKSEQLLEINELLLISFRQVPNKTSRFIVEEIIKFNDKLKVTIWGPEEISKIINKHKKQANNIANNLFSLRLENAVSKEVGDWQKEREGRIASLIESYERGQFSFFLGAGVSSSAGMPDWNTLLNSLFVSYLTKEFNGNTSVIDADINQIVARLNEIDEPSALMAARYLRKGLSKETTEIKEFTKTIGENLYRLRDVDKNLNSSLIIAIANLYAKKDWS